jgi:hypothetical protein
MIKIKEQEEFMHIIFDIIHIGISIESFESLIDRYTQKFGLIEFSKIINTKMKNQKYSNNYDYPLSKAVYQPINNFFVDNNFFNKKLDIIKLILKYGGNINCLKEKYNNYDIPLSYDELLENKLIDKEIYNYLTSYTSKILIRI